MEDFNVMTQNSILIHFSMDSIVENVKLESLRNSEHSVTKAQFRDRNWFFRHLI